jgi:hypothetical protein
MASHMNVAEQSTPRVEWCPERGAIYLEPIQASDESKGSMMNFVYMIRCADGTLYVVEVC